MHKISIKYKSEQPFEFLCCCKHYDLRWESGVLLLKVSSATSDTKLDTYVFPMTCVLAIKWVEHVTE